MDDVFLPTGGLASSAATDRKVEDNAAVLSTLLFQLAYLKCIQTAQGLTFDLGDVTAIYVEVSNLSRTAASSLALGTPAR